MASRSVTVTFTNNTSQALVLANAALQGGTWSQNMYPPSQINPGQKVTWESESNGFATGTQGTVTYNVQNGAGQAMMSWNDPFSGSNAYTQSATGPYRISPPSGGDGNNANVAFTLSPA
ncbi:aegerolysin family protein [Cystobacter fuscus]|uniref:aegerolysin family protein n=1 Tax=Cystobacter fuscus TaxID=43 RepID=UPI0037C16AF7